MKKTWPFFLAILGLSTALVCSPLPASAQTLSKGIEPPGRARPLEVVKSAFSRVLAAEGAKRRVEIRLVTEELFDFHEMSRRMLGARWQDGSGPEREEFVRLFTEMLERLYLTNVANMPLDTVRFQGESIAGAYARVSSLIPGRRGDTAIEYRLMDNGERWVVYDLAVDGVSLVSSYRSQFNSILRNSSFAELVERLRGREAAIKPAQGP